MHSIYPAPTSSISFRLSSWSCDGYVNIGLRALASILSHGPSPAITSTTTMQYNAMRDYLATRPRDHNLSSSSRRTFHTTSSTLLAGPGARKQPRTKAVPRQQARPTTKKSSLRRASRSADRPSQIRGFRTRAEELAQTSAQAPSSLASRSKAGRHRLIHCHP